MSAKRWPYRGGTLSHREAVAFQEAHRADVIDRWTGPPPATVAGVDVSVKGGEVRAAVVVCTFPELVEVERATAVRPLDWPYLPGLLAFREVPAFLEAHGKLAHEPDLLLVDGHGRAHPRRFGNACHLGVELDRPTLGVGKSLLSGTFREPGPRRGSTTRLLDGGEVVGRVVRTRDGVKPVFVSIGHRIDLETAVRVVLRCARRFRLPEPVRRADAVAGALPAGSRGPSSGGR